MAKREKPPEGLQLRAEPRRPETDPTLGISVASDGSGFRHRLVTVGDSFTQGFMSGAIHRTEISWPAIVAYELGLSPGPGSPHFRIPVYENPDGTGGLPLDIERLLRRMEGRFGYKLDWYEIVPALFWLNSYLDEIEDYWERGAGSKLVGGSGLVHNLAIFGWDVRDALSLDTAKLMARIPPPRDQSLHRQLVEHAQDRAGLVVLGGYRKPDGAGVTQLEAARIMGAAGGIETLVIALGSNNVLRAVTELDVRWSGPGFADLDRKATYTVWLPDHFASEWAELVEVVKTINAAHVIFATIPAVTIAPVARGVGQKRAIGSRYYRYYTRPWITDDRFTENDPHITGAQAQQVDSAIDAYNDVIIASVRTARQKGLDWLVFDLASVLDRLAHKRYVTDPIARPAWWTPYPLPAPLSRLLPLPNTRFFSSGPSGRIDGGLFSLDGIHPTTVASGVIGEEVAKIMKQACGVAFPDPTGQARDTIVDFQRVLDSDTLITRPPSSLDSTLSTIGWIDDKLDLLAGLYRR